MCLNYHCSKLYHIVHVKLRCLVKSLTLFVKVAQHNDSDLAWNTCRRDTWRCEQVNVINRFKVTTLAVLCQNCTMLREHRTDSYVHWNTRKHETQSFKFVFVKMT